MRSPVFAVVNDLHEADFCLFSNDDPKHVRNSEAFLKYPERCFAVCERDDPTYFLPSCYPANHKTWLGRGRAITIPYLLSAVSDPNPYVEDFSNQTDRPYLYSFRGAATSWVRKRMLKNVSGKPDTLMQDSSYYRHWDFDPSYVPSKDSHQQQYAAILAKSSFVLCPRGAGASSIRLFETMQAARVPVIIADNWVPLPEINFDDFAIVVAESDVVNVDKIVRARAHDFPRMSRNARRIWEQLCMPGSDDQVLLSALLKLKHQRDPIHERFIRAIFPLIELKRGSLVVIRKSVRAAVLMLLSTLRIKFPYSINR